MKKLLNFDAVIGSILLSSFVSTEVATTEKTEAKATETSKDIEDVFVKHFGAHSLFSKKSWTKQLLDWTYAGNLEQKLEELCTKAHKVAGLGESKVKSVAVNPSTLIFAHEKYPPKKILVVAYSPEDTWHNHHHHHPMHHYRYVTKGTREDCIFYLDLVNPGQYKLQKEVCGIEPVS